MALSGLKWCDFGVFFLSQMRCVLQELNLMETIGKKALSKTQQLLFSVLCRILNTKNINHSGKT